MTVFPPSTGNSECLISGLLDLRHNPLERDPLAGAAGAEDGFDDLHILDGIFYRNRYFRVLQNGPCKCVALQGVLVASGKDFGADAAPAQVAGRVDEQARGAVGQRIEGNLKIDAAFGSNHQQTLRGEHLRAARENRAARGKFQNSRSEAVYLGLGIALDTSDDANWFCSEGQAGGMNEIAADVEQPAAARRKVVADVGGIGVVVAVNTGDGAELANAALLD